MVQYVTYSVRLSLYAVDTRKAPPRRIELAHIAKVPHGSLNMAVLMGFRLFRGSSHPGSEFRRLQNHAANDASGAARGSQTPDVTGYPVTYGLDS